MVLSLYHRWRKDWAVIYKPMNQSKRLNDSLKQNNDGYPKRGIMKIFHFGSR